jgi:hypothetical protein
MRLLRHISRGGFPFPRFARVFRRERVENHGIGSASCFFRLFVCFVVVGAGAGPSRGLDGGRHGTAAAVWVWFGRARARGQSRPTHHSARTLRRALIFPAAAAAPLVLVTSGAPAREGGHPSSARAVRPVCTIHAPARGERRPSVRSRHPQQPHMGWAWARVARVRQVRGEATGPYSATVHEAT